MSIEHALDQARSGDSTAFNQLVDAFQSDAYHVAYHHLGHADEALDACQEAMLSAWRAIGSFKGDTARFRRWLLTIVVNACRDRARYERRRPRLPLQHDVDGDTRDLPLPDPGQSPEAYAQDADLVRLLHRALAQLSEDHRTVILLDHAGFSYGEMAESAGVEVGTIKSRLSRARAHMRDLLTGEAPLMAPTEPDTPSRRSPTMHRPPMCGTTPNQDGPVEHNQPRPPAR